MTTSNENSVVFRFACFTVIYFCKLLRPYLSPGRVQGCLGHPRTRHRDRRSTQESTLERNVVLLECLREVGPTGPASGYSGLELHNCTTAQSCLTHRCDTCRRVAKSFGRNARSTVPKRLVVVVHPLLQVHGNPSSCTPVTSDYTLIGEAIEPRHNVTAYRDEVQLLLL